MLAASPNLSDAESLPMIHAEVKVTWSGASVVGGTSHSALNRSNPAIGIQTESVRVAHALPSTSAEETLLRVSTGNVIVPNDRYTRKAEGATNPALVGILQDRATAVIVSSDRHLRDEPPAGC